MQKFLSAPFFAWKDRNKPYGEPNELFDGLQIVLSHLVLDPYSPFALAVPTSRGDYNIAKVYLWDQPFETIYRRAPEPEPVTRPRNSPAPSTVLFPKLKSKSPEPEPQMYLDLHSLLHVRNFWRRHFMAKEDATYFDMAEALMKMGNGPQKWHQGFQEPLVLETKWVGHYSCLHPWPKKLDKFEEKQCCAEDWHDHGIDPLVCDSCRLLSFPICNHQNFRRLLTSRHSPTTFIARNRRATYSPPSHLDPRLLENYQQRIWPASRLLAVNFQHYPRLHLHNPVLLQRPIYLSSRRRPTPRPILCGNKPKSSLQPPSAKIPPFPRPPSPRPDSFNLISHCSRQLR